MNDTSCFSQEMKSRQYLAWYTLELFLIKWRDCSIFGLWWVFQVLVEVRSQKFENQNHVFPKWERIYNSNNASLICWVFLFYGCQYPILNLAVIEVELFISTDLDSDLFALVLNVKTFDDLSECSFVDDFSHEIPITNLFPNACPIIPLGISAFTDALPSVATHCVDLFEKGKFWFLKRS